MIELDNVTLFRRIPSENSLDLKGTLFSMMRGRYRPPAKRCVLRDLSLRIEPGEKIGIVGANGAGKSTLLKVISGIIEPTQGRVRAEGRIAPLIELGAGFDPELSVKDNILLYGVLLGCTRAEMRAKLDEILSFAELEEYRETPVRTLSSGMLARLGFAVATDARPDVLVVDEVLSVGDEYFRYKAKARMDQLWTQHTTVVIVTHDLHLVRSTCQRAVWLDHGRLAFDGDANAAVSKYLRGVDEMAVETVTRARQQLAAGR